MAEGKPFSAWLSGELLSKAEKQAKNFDDNTSKYVRALIERDVATSPGTLLIELAKVYQPAQAEALAAALEMREKAIGKAVDGRVVLARFLDAFAQALTDQTFRPDQPFELLDPSKAADFARISEQRMQDLAERVATIQEQRQAQYGTQAHTDGAMSGRSAAKAAVKAAKLGASIKKSKAS